MKPRRIFLRRKGGGGVISPLSKLMREEGLLVAREFVSDQHLSSERCRSSPQSASSAVLGSRTDA